MNFYKSRESEFLAKADVIILENLVNDQFGVSVMASEMGMSRSSLHRKIKSSTGVPTSRYIRSVKLGTAMSLLKESSSNITEIAFESGFSSIAYFVSCFREEYGTSPNVIRKEIRAEDKSNSGSETFSGNKQTGKPKIESKNLLHNFPLQINSFIGRQKEMDAIAGLLKSHRIVSLVGSGGCGKTRLAYELVPLLDQEYRDGIWFVDLASVEKGNLVVKEIMETLSLSESAGDDMIEMLVEGISGMKLLLILDNCEHLAVSCAEVSGRLVQSVSGLTILTTSRMVLNIVGEKVWRIPSLNLIEPESVKTVEQANESEAVQLFVDRAQLSDPRFELSIDNIRDVTTICKRVDGIPLAIELVASHIRYLDPARILDRLKGRFSELTSPVPGTIERHKTLNATIDWSYKLLTDEEKTLFRRLSVFSGGFDLISVEEVCKDESLPLEYILDLLSSLVDRSIVNTIRMQAQPIRYYLLETLRQYAAGLMEDNEEKSIRKRHLDYFITVAEEAYKNRVVSQAFWMEKLQLDHDNIIAALNWSEHSSRSKFKILAGAISWFWARSKNYILGRQILGRLIKTGMAGNETRARILAGYAWILVSDYNQMPEAIDSLKQSFTIWHRLKNINEEALVRADFALMHYGIFEDETGFKHSLEAYELAQVENAPGVLLYCMMPLSQGFVNLKKLDKAKEMAKKVLVAGEELDNLLAQFIGHHNLGDCALMEDEFHKAEKEYASGVEITQQYGDMNYMFTDLTGIAMAVAGMGRYPKALRLIGAVNEAARKAKLMSLEDFPMHFWQEQIKKHIHGTREKLGKELTNKYESEGRAMDLDETINYALDFEKD